MKCAFRKCLAQDSDAIVAFLLLLRRGLGDPMERATGCFWVCAAHGRAIQRFEAARRGVRLEFVQGLDLLAQNVTTSLTLAKVGTGSLEAEDLLHNGPARALEIARCGFHGCSSAQKTRAAFIVSMDCPGISDAGGGLLDVCEGHAQAIEASQAAGKFDVWLGKAKPGEAKKPQLCAACFSVLDPKTLTWENGKPIIPVPPLDFMNEKKVI